MSARRPATPVSALGRAPKTLHPSLELLVRKLGGASPEEAIRTEARRVVAHARSLGWGGPPFDPRVLASLLGIRDRPVHGLAQDALIVPLRDGSAFEILWNDSVPVTRRNFTFGHEITHTFFPDCAEAVRARGPLHKCDPQKPLEALCNVGASELLLPFVDFKPDVERSGVSLSTIDVLRRRYEASREAVAMRMVALDVEACAVAFLTCRLSPREARASAQLAFHTVDRPEPKYRVDMMFTSNSFRADRLPLHKSVPDDSCVYSAAALQRGVVDGFASAEESWMAGHGRLPVCRVTAMTIPPNGDGEPRVLALLLR